MDWAFSELRAWEEMLAEGEADVESETHHDGVFNGEMPEWMESTRWRDGVSRWTGRCVADDND
jgi:hypothetical protein